MAAPAYDITPYNSMSSSTPILPMNNNRKQSYTASIICIVAGVLIMFNGLSNQEMDSALLSGFPLVVIGGVLYFLKKSKTQQ
jgi:hypothetical protein